MNRRRLLPTCGGAALHRRPLSTVVDLAHLSSPIPPSTLAALPSKSSSELLASYTVTPPIQPWPRTLTPRKLAHLIRRTPDPLLSLSIFTHALRFHPNFTPTYLPYHAIISRLAAARAFRLLPPVLASLRAAPFRCGEDAFITLIRAYSLASRPASSLRTFLSIPSFRLQPSVRSFNALLHAMLQNRRFRLLALLFHNSRKRFSITPNVYTCNILVNALCKLGDVTSALHVIDQMPEWGLAPNLVTYTTVISAHCANGDMPRARSLFDQIVSRGWSPDATTYTVLVDGYCRNNMLTDATRTMDEMASAGVPPNEVTYSVVIGVCCGEGRAGEALSLIGDMIDERHIPSSALCCRVIDVLCEGGRVEDAMGIWRRMLRRNVTPDNSISSTLIYWMCKAGKVWEARKLFDEFERGFVPSVMTYNTIIAGMCENGELQEAGRLWDDMLDRKCPPNVFTYNVLIKAFCKAGKAKEGVRVLEEMLENKCVPNKFTYQELVDGLFKSGEEEMIGEILEIAAITRGGLLDEDSWGVFVRNVVTDTTIWREQFSAVVAA